MLFQDGGTASPLIQSNFSNAAPHPDTCRWCGLIHTSLVCPRVKRIEYYPDGATVKSVELWPPRQEVPNNVSICPDSERY